MKHRLPFERICNCFTLRPATVGSATKNIIRGCRVLFQPEITTDPSTHKRLKKLIQGMTFQSSASPVSAKEIEERGKDEPQP